MKLIQLATLLIVLFSLHGCGFRDEGDVEIKKAVLYSPDEEFEFKRDEKYSDLFHVYDSRYRISISLFPINKINYLEIRSIAEKSIYDVEIKFDTKNLYYQLNDGKKIKLDIEKHNYSDFKITAPSTMDYYSSDGDGLHVTRQRQKITREHRKKAKKQTYRYYIPFTLDNKDYTIDVTFKLKLKSTPFIGVPGMP